MNHVTWHNLRISKRQRRDRNEHSSFVLWLTGLSGSGKSTLANALESKLYALGTQTYLLDGDNLRMGINANLGFAPEDRSENIRRVAEVAKLFVDAGTVVIAALISPGEADREKAKRLFDPDEFFEIHVDCPLEVCQQRDPKGLYQKALQGQIQNFTGIHSPYDVPKSPALAIRTDKVSVEDAADIIVDFLRQRHLLPFRPWEKQVN